MVVKEKAVVPLTVLASRLPPGARVVSTSTRVDPADCGPGEVVEERVMLVVPAPVTRGVGEILGEDPEDGVPLCVGVGDGEANTTPCTKMGELYTVPALVAEFHTRVRLPMAPVHTLLNCSTP